MTAQIERIKASGAQAIIAGVTGSPAATVLKGMVQSGLDIERYQAMLLTTSGVVKT